MSSDSKVMTPLSGGERAGIGIILALGPDFSLYVHTVCPSGSAEGYLQPGDILMKIGSKDVYRSLACVRARDNNQVM